MNERMAVKLNNLMIVTTGYFDTVECNFYGCDDEMYMTINQLARALEYSSKKGIENIVSRNQYLIEPEFSTTHVLRVVEGGRNVNREMRLFTEDGIYEVAFLSEMPKARLFRAWVRKLIKAYRSGILQPVNLTPEPNIFDSFLAEIERKVVLGLYDEPQAIENNRAGKLPMNNAVVDAFIGAINEALNSGEYYLYRHGRQFQPPEGKTLLGAYDAYYFYIISQRAYELYAAKEKKPMNRRRLYEFLLNGGYIIPSWYASSAKNSKTRPVGLQGSTNQCLTFNADRARIQPLPERL